MFPCSGCQTQRPQTPWNRPTRPVPANLCRWVGEIVQSSPGAARLTVAEPIIGAMLAGGGHVTQAFLALMPRLGLITVLCGIIRRPGGLATGRRLPSPFLQGVIIRAVWCDLEMRGGWSKPRPVRNP